MTARWTRPGATGLLLATFVLIGTVPSSQARSTWGFLNEMDLAATALAEESNVTVADEAYDEAWARRARVTADSTATASARCRGCVGSATALQVVYVSWSRAATLNNVAVAWSKCTSCRATALSVQVVILHRARGVDANNSALSVNAACTGCRSSAVAVQLVVVDDSGRRLSHAAIRRLRAWVDQQSAALNEATVAARTRPSTGPQRRRVLDGLERLVNGELGSRTLRADVELVAR